MRLYFFSIELSCFANFKEKKTEKVKKAKEVKKGKIKEKVDNPLTLDPKK